MKNAIGSLVAFICLGLGLAHAQDFDAAARATALSATGGVVTSVSGATDAAATLGGAGFLGGGFANATGGVAIDPAGPGLVNTATSNDLAGAGVVSGAGSTGPGAATVAGGIAGSAAVGLGEAGWQFCAPGDCAGPPIATPLPIVLPVVAPGP